MSSSRDQWIRSAATFSVACLLPLGIATAQPNGTTTGGEGEGTSRQLTTISTVEGLALTSEDGGRTWRFVDPTTTQNLRTQIGRELQGLTTSNMTANTSVRPDPSGTVALVDFVMPQSGDVVITLHDVHGVEVERRTEYLDSVGPHQIALDISTLTAGAYVLRITTNSVMTGSGKLVITR